MNNDSIWFANRSIAEMPTFAKSIKAITQLRARFFPTDPKSAKTITVTIPMRCWVYGVCRSVVSLLFTTQHTNMSCGKNSHSSRQGRLRLGYPQIRHFPVPTAIDATTPATLLRIPNFASRLPRALASFPHCLPIIYAFKSPLEISWYRSTPGISPINSPFIHDQKLFSCATTRIFSARWSFV